VAAAEKFVCVLIHVHFALSYYSVCREMCGTFHSIEQHVW